MPYLVLTFDPADLQALAELCQSSEMMSLFFAILNLTRVSFSLCHLTCQQILPLDLR